MVTFEQFKALDIRIAKIISCEVHPNADKLYVITVEVGDKQKKVVAGIKNYYTKEELVGKSVVLVDNLEPAVIRGVESEGMILATREGEKLAVLIPDRTIASGSPVS